MLVWSISRMDPSAVLRSGAAGSITEAWAHALAAVLDVLGADTALDRCWITVDTEDALLVSARTAGGELDRAATHDAAEHLYAAVTGGTSPPGAT